MRTEAIKAGAWGIVFTTILGILIIVGSRNLSHFDAALIGYTFAVLFAVFGITYRYAMWLQRPPTAVYWRRGWQVFLQPKHIVANLFVWPQKLITDISLNSFIFRRGSMRGLTHMLIMWGCIIAGLITFPLVFGWIHFESVPAKMDHYRVFLFGFSTSEFAVHSWMGFLIFHGLVWSAFLVIAGVMLAMRRRMRDRSAAAVQEVIEDFMPLILLFSISLSGLLLTVSYTWMKGYAYDFLAVLHAITVIFTLLWLPFGKFFHIFQRPAQLGVSFYKEAGAKSEPALCRRCHQPYSSRMHIEDLIEVEKKLGYQYEVNQKDVEHYQWICPPCRRALFAIAQGMLSQPVAASSTDENVGGSYVNKGMRQGPLGTEDRDNFHP